MTHYRTDASVRHRPTSRGASGSLWSAVRRLQRHNDSDYPEWDADHEDDHLARRGPVYVQTWETTCMALRPFVEEAPMDVTESEWGKRLREAVEARRAARRPWGRLPDAG